MKLLVWFVSLLLTILMAFSGLAAEENDSADEYWPTNAWKSAYPEAQGIDSDALVGAIEDIEKEKLDLHSLLVIRNGSIVLDAVIYPYEENTVHDIASCSKSVLSLLLGIAIDQGYVQGVHSLVMDSFPSYGECKEKESIRIADLLTMQAGFSLSPHPLIKEYEMVTSPDYEKYIMALKMEGESGIMFQYNNMAPYLVSAIIHKRTGVNALEFAEKNLFSPLGITDYQWPADQVHNNTLGWGELRIKPQDFAKIGYLMLKNGRWEDRQVVSSAWIEQSTGMRVKFSDAEKKSMNASGYGYYWWINMDSTVSARGRNGQLMYLFPQKNLIVVASGSGMNSKAGGDFNQRVEKLIYDYILPAIKSDSPLHENLAGVTALTSAIDRLNNTKQIVKAGANRQADAYLSHLLQTSYLNKAYVMGDSLLGIETLLLKKTEDNAIAVEMFFQNGGVHGDKPILAKLPLDGSVAYAFGRFGMPLMAQLTEMTEDSLLFSINEIGNIDRWTVKIAFRTEGMVAVTFIDELGMYRNTTIDGQAE